RPGPTQERLPQRRVTGRDEPKRLEEDHRPGDADRAALVRRGNRAKITDAIVRAGRHLGVIVEHVHRQPAASRDPHPPRPVVAARRCLIATRLVHHVRSKTSVISTIRAKYSRRPPTVNPTRATAVSMTPIAR